MKTCTKCGQTKPTTDFGKYSGKRNGLRSCCKACHNSSNAAWRVANPEYNAAYYEANREKMLESQASYREVNRDKIREYDAARQKANPSRNREAKAKWRKANPQKARQSKATWAASNPEYYSYYREANREKLRKAFRVYGQNRRARKAGGKLSKGLSERLFKLQRGKCACCGKPLGDDYHLDHIMPLALGGTNTDGNIQLLRAECNRQKRAKHPVDFMRERGLLL